MYDILNGDKKFVYEIRNRHTHKTFLMYFSNTQEIAEYFNQLDQRAFELVSSEILRQDELHFSGEDSSDQTARRDF